MITAYLERTRASKQFSDRDLKQAFDLCLKQNNGDVGQTFMALHLEVSERCAQLEARLSALEDRKKR